MSLKKVLKAFLIISVLLNAFTLPACAGGSLSGQEKALSELYTVRPNRQIAGFKQLTEKLIFSQFLAGKIVTSAHQFRFTENQLNRLTFLNLGHQYRHWRNLLTHNFRPSLPRGCELMAS